MNALKNSAELLLPEEVTPLRVPIVLLNTVPEECRTPEEFADEVLAQLARCHYPVLQLHVDDGAVYQVDSPSLLETCRDVWSHLSTRHSYAVALRSPLASDRRPNIFRIIEADTQLTLRYPWHATLFAGVNELAHALEVGTALRCVNLAVHTHRRQEIASVVADILKRPMLPGDTDSARVHREAAETLQRIDRLCTVQSALRARPNAVECGAVVIRPLGMAA